jgi:hypothetical protein
LGIDSRVYGYAVAIFVGAIAKPMEDLHRVAGDWRRCPIRGSAPNGSSIRVHDDLCGYLDFNSAHQ